MELELGIKITRTRDNASTSTDFKVSRDSLGQLSLSRETDSVFFLILHLKGFKKEGIEIEINKEGNRIKISGRKQLEEMVLIKWVEWRKEIEVKEFKKVFLIPNIVNVDKIKARFNEEDGTLTITMPKKVKGISGFKIEEEEEEKAEPEEEIKEETIQEEQEEEEEEEEEPKREEEEPKREEEEEEDKIEEDFVEEEEETRDHEEKREEIEEDSKPKPKKRRKKCRFPFVAGSTLLMSIIVFIIQLIQSRRK